MSVLVSIGIAGIMALRSPPAVRAPAEPGNSAALNSERSASVPKNIATEQTKPHLARKDKTAHVARKRTPAVNPSANETYGYAEEPRRRIYPNPFFVFPR
jgi:hypothetical protein